jgi:hypothetical protein
LLASTPAFAQSLTSGWFVILGSYPAARGRAEALNTERVMMEARRCGLSPVEGGSNTFVGMRPGLVMQFVGGYRSRVQAEAARTVVRRCLPDAVVRPGALVLED